LPLAGIAEALSKYLMLCPVGGEVIVADEQSGVNGAPTRLKKKKPFMARSPSPARPTTFFNQQLTRWFN
jgi:hypothetical protein